MFGFNKQIIRCEGSEISKSATMTVRRNTFTLSTEPQNGGHDKRFWSCGAQVLVIIDPLIDHSAVIYESKMSRTDTELKFIHCLSR